MKQRNRRVQFALAAMAMLALCGGPALACPAAELVGTWKATRLAGQTLSADTDLTLEFTAEGRLGGRSACNRYGASYRLEGATLHVTEPFATRMACAAPLMQTEQRFLMLLRQPLACTFGADGRLTLRDAAGGKLVARRQP
jgi:heat shock protein HslJ